MALNIANLEDLKYYQSEIEKSKNKYNDTLDKIVDLVRLSAIYWQGEDGNNFRAKLYSLVKTNLSSAADEMQAESQYLKRLILVLENTQEQIKNRLND